MVTVTGWGVDLTDTLWYCGNVISMYSIPKICFFRIHSPNFRDVWMPNGMPGCHVEQPSKHNPVERLRGYLQVR